MNTKIAEEAKAQGNAAFQQGDYTAAVERYTEAISSSPQEHTYYSNRSAAFCKLGKFRKALEDAKKCVQLAPDWPKGHYRMGEASMGLGLPARACEAYRAALRISPKDDTIQQALAKAEHEMNKKSLVDDDEDGPSPNEMSSQCSHNSSLGSSTKRSEAFPVCRQSIGISSMEEYIKFREAGGARLPQDPTISTFLTTIPPIKKSSSRGDVLASVGILKPDESHAPSSHAQTFSDVSRPTGDSPGDNSVAPPAKGLSKTTRSDSFSSQDKPAKAKASTAPQEATAGSKLTGAWAKMFASDTEFAKLHQNAEEQEPSSPGFDEKEARVGDKENLKSEHKRKDDFSFLEQQYHSSSRGSKAHASNAGGGTDSKKSAAYLPTASSEPPTKNFSKVLGVSLPFSTNATTSSSSSSSTSFDDSRPNPPVRKSRAASDPFVKCNSETLAAGKPTFIYPSTITTTTTTTTTSTTTSAKNESTSAFPSRSGSASYRDLLLNQFRGKRKVLHDSGTTAMMAGSGSGSGSSGGGSMDERYRKFSQSLDSGGMESYSFSKSSL